MRRRTSRHNNAYPVGASAAVELKTQRAYETERYYKEMDMNSRKKPRIRVRKRPNLVYKDVGQTHAKFSGFVVATIAFVFVCAMGVALSYAALYSKQMLIASLNTELKQKREANALLESEISKNYDLKEIERIATTKLGMSKPKAHQIIHIYVPKQSYVIQVEDADTAPSDTPFSFLKRLIDGDVSLPAINNSTGS